MIVGTGTDVAEVTRIRHCIARHGERFLARVFTPGEIAYCQHKGRSAAESFAARFAAKEAGAKALGTGIACGVSWLQLEVTRLDHSRPTLLFHGQAAERVAAMGVRAVHLSLSHGRAIAVATVILET